MLLDSELDENTEIYLKKMGWISENDRILFAEKPGEGNMNFVLRIKTEKGSLILKQSRPYVEKYKHVAAPQERIEVENTFYQVVSNSTVIASHSPKIIGFDSDNFILAMEDLGESRDFLSLYKTQEIAKETLDKLVDYTLALHTLQVGGFPSNQKMKVLNHEHIFVYPYLEDNGFDLNTIQLGLQEVAMKYKTDEGLKVKLKKLGDQYLAKGATLLHGDFYPGSWLAVEGKIKVIDPEFAFMGDAEFDLAVICAHLKMAKVEVAQIDYLVNRYSQVRSFDQGLFDQFLAVEIMRRLIGLAQLPLVLNIDEKKELLEEAAQTILNYA